jgi:hypothetical protein
MINIIKNKKYMKIDITVMIYYKKIYIQRIIKK